MFFEGEVLDLLLSMRYGDFRESTGHTTQACNDEGIDWRY